MRLTITPQNIHRATNEDLASPSNTVRAYFEFPGTVHRYALVENQPGNYILHCPTTYNQAILEQRGLAGALTGELTAAGRELQLRFGFRYADRRVTGTLPALAQLVRHLMGQEGAPAIKPTPKSAIELKAEKLEAQAKELREQAAREAKEAAEKAVAKAKRAAELKRKKELAALKPLTRRMIAVLEARPDAWGCQREATIEILEAIADQKFAHLIGTK